MWTHNAVQLTQHPLELYASIPQTQFLFFPSAYLRRATFNAEIPLAAQISIQHQIGVSAPPPPPSPPPPQMVVSAPHHLKCKWVPPTP